MARISIVVPSFNQAATLERTLQSLLAQNFAELEILVFDGGSTDGSAAIIEKYAPHLTYWQSEPDAGQSDAIARGLARATGELFNWLNSDDTLESGALRRIDDEYARSRADVIVGRTRTVDSAGNVVRVWEARPPRSAASFFRDNEVVMAQPSTFIRRELLLEVGGIDETLHYVMDWELYLRIALRKPDAAVHAIDALLASALQHAAAKTQTSGAGFRREAAQVIEKLRPEMPPAARAAANQALRTMRLQDAVVAAMASERPFRELGAVVRSHPAALSSRFFWGGLLRAFHRS